MPRLQIPDEKPQGNQPLNANAAAGAVASAAKLGQLQAGPGAEAVANRAKLGEIQSTQGAKAAADSGEVGRIMMGPGAAAAAQFANIGKAAMNAGQEVMAQGNAYFEKAMGAIDDAIYNNSYADASKEYNQRISERLSRPYDENGNPTFSTLQADIDKIGAEVGNKYASKNSNPESYNRFATNFGSLTTSKSIGALEQARKWQLQDAQGSLANGLNAAKTNALSDSKEMLPQYLTQGNEQIDNAVKNGYISPEEGVAQKERLRKDINVGWLDIQNQKDPLGTNQLLQQDAKALGINEMEKTQLLQSNAQHLNQLDAQNKRRVAEEKALQNEVWTRNALDLRLGIDRGTINQTDLDASYTKGDISQAQHVALIEKSMAVRGETSAKTTQRLAVGASIKNGEILAGKYTNAQVNDHYQYSLSLQGGNVPLYDPKVPMDKTRLASIYKAPVTGFTDELSGVVMSGSPEQIMGAVKAYTYVQEKNPAAVANLDAKTVAMLTTIEMQDKFTNNDPGTIIANARKSILDINPTIEEARKKQFDNEDAFKSANINSTIKNMYGENNWFSEDVGSVPDYALPVIQNLLQQNYMLSGDSKIAIEMTKKQTAGIIGPSKINGASHNMFMPPEYAYPQYNYEINGESALRMDMKNSVQAVLKSGSWADQSNISPDDIEVRSFEGTSRQMGNAKYMLYNKNTNNPIVNPDSGQPVVWSPDGEWISENKTLENEASQNRKLGLEQGNTDIFKSYVSAPGQVGGSTSKQVISTALSYLGYNEQSHREVIGSFISKSVNKSIDPSKTPWCAAFANGILASNGIQGTDSLAAKSFLKWGQPTNQPTKGDIVVLNRTNDPNKGHVGFYMGRNEQGQILILGGNQGSAGQVSIQAYDSYKVAGFRKPPSANEIQDIVEVEMKNSKPDSPLAKEINKALPIGIRQNNPGNLKKTGNRWSGELPNATSTFKEFATPEDGIAGIYQSLKTKQIKRGTTTPQELIYGKKQGNRFVGAYSETDQAAYVQLLSQELGIKPTDKYDLNNPKQALKLIKAIIKMENGYVPYTDATIMTGILRNK